MLEKRKQKESAQKYAPKFGIIVQVSISQRLNRRVKKEKVERTEKEYLKIKLHSGMLRENHCQKYNTSYPRKEHDDKVVLP